MTAVNNATLSEQSPEAVSVDLHRLVMHSGGYRTIVADPPWQYGKWGGNSGRTDKCKTFAQRTRDLPLPYPTMSVEEICQLEVGRIAADDCDLYLWTTAKYLPDSFRVVESWGFRYCQTLVWCKTPRGTGQGGLYCPTTEFLVLARKGKMPEGKKRLDTTWWAIKRNNSHSKKPEYFQDVIESVSDAPRIELFARRRRLGWDGWGYEA